MHHDPPRTVTDTAAARSTESDDEIAPFDRRLTVAARIQRQLHAHPELGPLIVLVASSVVFGITNSRFIAAANISLMLQQVTVVAALSAAQTLVILTAGIDLSIGAAMILSQLVMAQAAVNNHVAPISALLIGIIVGIGTGVFNGALITRFRLPPFIATLGTLSIITSTGLLYSNGQTTLSPQLPYLLNWPGYAVKFGPLSLINGVPVVLGLYLVVSYILGHTRWGRHVYAVGNDVDAARLAGIRTNRVLFSVYVLSGLVIGIVAWLSIGYTGAASPNNAVNANLESITAVVIGGTSLFGGRGSVLGTLFGALIVVVFASGLTLANVNDLYQPMAEGVLVLAAVAVDQWIRGVKA